MHVTHAADVFLLRYDYFIFLFCRLVVVIMCIIMILARRRYVFSAYDLPKTSVVAYHIYTTISIQYIVYAREECLHCVSRVGFVSLTLKRYDTQRVTTAVVEAGSAGFSSRSRRS